MDLAAAQPSLPVARPLRRAWWRVVRFSLTVGDAALELALRALGDIARAVDPRATLAMTEPPGAQRLTATRTWCHPRSFTVGESRTSTRAADASPGGKPPGVQRLTATRTWRRPRSFAAFAVGESRTSTRAADVSPGGKPAHELPWSELAFLAIDVETTGFAPASDRVIEVAWVRFERKREVERFSSLLRTDVDVPLAVRRLTGISPSMLVGKPSFSDVAPGLLEALACVDFAVAYNARFDRGFLSAELGREHRVLPDVPWVDPLAFVRQLEGPAKSAMPKGLVDVARRFGVAVPSAHRAESDARATGELLLRLAPRLGAHALADLVDKQER